MQTAPLPDERKATFAAQLPGDPAVYIGRGNPDAEGDGDASHAFAHVSTNGAEHARTVTNLGHLLTADGSYNFATGKMEPRQLTRSNAAVYLGRAAGIARLQEEQATQRLIDQRKP